jgi:hypothetical protein
MLNREVGFAPTDIVSQVCQVRKVPIVAKVLGWRTKIPRAADASYARRREGPYRFIQNRSRTSVAALKNDAAAEKPKEQLWRRFSGLFDFRLLQQYLPEAEVAFSLDRPVAEQKRRWDREGERRSLGSPHGLAPGLVRGFQRFASQKDVSRLMGWSKLAISLRRA